MIEVLRTVNGLWKRLSLYFSILCIFRQLLLFFFWWLVIIIFLFFLSLLVRWLFLYISYVLGGAFIKKKKYGRIKQVVTWAVVKCVPSWLLTQTVIGCPNGNEGWFSV
jgi:mannose/fructose/N-acetylgalactosamine-specific phosphotransferase system component IID